VDYLTVFFRIFSSLSVFSLFFHLLYSLISSLDLCARLKTGGAHVKFFVSFNIAKASDFSDKTDRKNELFTVR